MKNIFLLVVFAMFSGAVQGQNIRKTYHYTNGFWYNGTEFVKAEWYVVNGLLSKKAPSKVDSIVDLGERWVVPPMGDVFCSSISENPAASSTTKLYFDEGFFYLQVLANTQEGRTTVQGTLNKSNSPDAIFANGAITCSLGYPFTKFEGPALGIKNPQMWGQKYDQIKTSRKMHGNAYWFIDNKTALTANWEKIKAQKPSVISIYLLDTKNNGGKEGKGLSEEMAKAIVKKAHKADLRVYAHVETPEDVRLGIKLGVDGFANLPGHDWDGKGESKKFDLSDDDLKKLAKKKIPVSPVFSHALANGANPTVQEYHSQVLLRLLNNNVNLVLGSDDSQRTGRGELNYWFNLKGADYSKMLKILVENTPKAVFPDRKIGKIEDGYEASFLVLNDNPLVNILKIRAVSFKVKNGIVIK
jgi:hypothetical protein